MDIRPHRPRKRFGQHFLHDPTVIDKIVANIAPRPREVMVEIGPGLGAITRPLLQRLGTLHVVELDRDLIPQLQLACAPLGHLDVHACDVLRFDFSALVSGAEQLRIVGNLPYNIATPFVFHLLKSPVRIQDMHFLLQKEVVDRLTASPGSSDYGRLSVMVQYHCQTARLFKVGAGAFSPPPNVESAFVRLTPHRSLPYPARDEQRFAKIVKSAFTQRRKTLKNALKDVMPSAKIAHAGIDPSLRAEALTVAQFVTLANADT